jgi:transposase
LKLIAGMRRRALDEVTDLRERIVRAVEAGASRNAVGAEFDVSISFVVKLLQRWRDRGAIAPDQNRKSSFSSTRQAPVGRSF